MSLYSENEELFSEASVSVEERHRRERKARGDAILAAAARVFARHGLEGATVEMVAREAEVAVGTIYLYFSSRDDLYLSLVVERADHLRARYLETHARALMPLAELRAIAAAYLDHLRDSREVFLSQQSVSYAQLSRRLRRPSEIRHFKRVMELSHEIFALWERTIKRCLDAGVIANAMGPKRTAAVMWASLNGAFMLMGDDNFFRDVTGLNPEHFIEEALESHLAASQTALARRAEQPRDGAARRKRLSAGAVRTSRARNTKEKQPDELAATAPA